MTKIKRLSVAIALTLGLSLAAYADCTEPGIMSGPPCIPAAQPVSDDAIAPGQIDGPPAVAESPSLVWVELTEIALNALTLF
jgi:hypothetical protein